MSRTRSRNKVFADEKKDRKDSTLARKIEELEKENAKLRREIEALKASGKVAVVKEKKPAPVKFQPPSQEELDRKKQETIEKIKKWRIETWGEYEEE